MPLWRIAARIEVWRAAWALWRERPWLGWGPNTFPIFFMARLPDAAFGSGGMSILEGQPDALNDWLQILSTTGLAGAAAYAWAHWEAGRTFWARFRSGIPAPQAAAWSVLAAVFVQWKMNAASWEAAFLAACLGGAVLGSSEAGRGRAAVFAGVGSVFLVAVSWLMAADRRAAMGFEARAQGRPRESAVHWERALALNPWRQEYRLGFCNLLWDAAGVLEGGERRAVLERAVLAARSGYEKRPADSAALFLWGTAELRLCESGAREACGPAVELLEQAQKRNRHLPGLRETLKKIGV